MQIKQIIGCRMGGRRERERDIVYVLLNVFVASSSSSSSSSLFMSSLVWTIPIQPETNTQISLFQRPDPRSIQCFGGLTTARDSLSLTVDEKVVLHLQIT